MNIYISAVVAFVVVAVLPKSTAIRAYNCTKCTDTPWKICSWEDSPPALGGPPCQCSLYVDPKGCTLKPCIYFSSDLALCDSSLGSSPVLRNAYTFLCNGFGGKCEYCLDDFPPHCTEESLKNPPIALGPPCSCNNKLSPSGCTLLPCSDSIKGPCVCQSNAIWEHCYHPRCPSPKYGNISGYTPSTKLNPVETTRVPSQDSGDHNGTKCNLSDCRHGNMPPADNDGVSSATCYQQPLAISHHVMLAVVSVAVVLRILNV